MKHVIIIGGGIGGLAAANLLAARGCKVTVFEGRDQLGGRAGTREHDGFRFDTGPSWYLMPEVYEHFFAQLGRKVSDEIDLIRLDPAYRIFSEHHATPITITSDVAVVSALFEQLEPGAGRRLTQYLKQAERVYGLALKHFLYTDFSSLRSLLQPRLLRDVPGLIGGISRSLDKLVSSRFKHPLLRQILEYPTVFLGGSPYSTPALYSLMSYLDLKQGVYYPRGGIYTIIEALVRIGREQGVSYHTGQSVSRINVKDGKAVGITLADGSQVASDVVISNTDLHYAQTELLTPETADYPPRYWRKREAGPSALLMYLGVRGTLPQLTHHNLFFTDAWEANFNDIFKHKLWPRKTSLYVSKPSETDPTVAPADSENMFVLVPLPASLEAQPENYETYAADYLRQIAAQANIPDLLERILFRQYFTPQDFASDLHAWKGSALGLSHRLSQSALFRPAVRSRKVSGLYYVGGDVRPGIGMPMCLISSELAADYIVKRIKDTN